MEPVEPVEPVDTEELIAAGLYDPDAPQPREVDDSGPFDRFENRFSSNDQGTQA